MRVLLLNSYFDEPRGGGTEVVLSILSQGLARRGHRVCVVSTRADSGCAHSDTQGVDSVKLGIRNLYWPLDPKHQPAWKRLLWHAVDRYNPAAAADVATVARDFKPDIVSVHNLMGFSAAAWVALAQLGRPLVHMLHDYQLICSKTTMFKNGAICQHQCGSCSVFRGPYRERSNLVSAVIACSQKVLDIHRQEGYFLRVPRQVVIPHARDIRRAAASSTPVPVARDDTCITFGFIGSLVPIKGIELLLEAFSRFIGTARRRVRLLVAGDGKDDFAQGLRQRFAAEQIVFLGRVEPNAFYPLLDVLVVPSLSNDTFPFVVYEALGYGVPVIGSRRGGIPEVVQDGVTGLLFDPEDPGALQGALRALCDETRRREMAGRGPASVAHLLDEDRFVTAHEALYLELIEAANAHQPPGAPDMARQTAQELKR